MSKFIGRTFIVYNFGYYLIRPWAFFHDLYREIRTIVRRGLYGYDVSDTWSLDNYLSQWMPAALSHLQENMHGVPMTFAGEDKDQDKAVKEWNEVLDKMIIAFTIAKESDEWSLPDDFDAMTGKEQKKFWKKLKKDQKVLEKARVEGMNLFVKHYYNLWD